MPMLSGLRGRRDDKLKKSGKDKQAAAAAPDTPPVLPEYAEYAPPTREVVRPANQLQLSEAELREEVAKMLTANNPAAPQNLARFNMKERSYKFEPMVEQHVVHYASDGWLLHKSSEDARKQLEQEKGEAEAAARFQAEMDRALKEKAAGMDVELPDDSRHLRNQFNFSERAAQTFSYPMRDRATFTEPAPTATISGSCCMREIYDEYCRDFERQRQEEASKQRPGAKKVASSTNAAAAAAAVGAVGGGGGSDTAAADAGGAAASSSGGGGGVGGAGGSGGGVGNKGDQGSGSVEQQWAALEGMLDKLRILDRMVNQNTFADVAMDFKYWDDTSDALRPGEGSLLPLWQFVCEQGRKHVTSMCWSSLYADQFAVGYGSFHYQRQGTGAISIFSLKNPSHAELAITTTSGVMALQFHPEYANLLAVGCYDGSVAVYDVRQKSNKPLYVPSPKAKKHSDAVWQVCWQVDELQKSLAFVSISTDGDVLLWTLAMCELLPERLIHLRPSAQHQAGDSSASGVGVTACSGAASSSAVAAADEMLPQQQADGGLCMDFSKFPGREHVYLVGSESGNVYQCSKAYGSDYLASFAGHCMPVYAVKWNCMHPDMFLSCSADWSIKVWDVKQQQAPLLTFDVGAAVGDVAWAPYSSTVFAAVTDDGKVHVFDLAQNRQLQLCAQKCAKKARLTRVAFNPRYSVLLVGDSKGNVSALKLSPNLRKAVVNQAGGSNADKQQASGVILKHEEAERQKLEQVIAVARRSQPPALAAAGAAH